MAICSNGGTISFPRVRDEAQAVGVRVLEAALEVTLADGRMIRTPLSFYPTLQRATARQRREWAYLPYLTGLRWEELDLDLSVGSIVGGRREVVFTAGDRRRLKQAQRAAGMKPLAA